MSAENNPYMSLEDQYQVAGWDVAYSAMAEYGMTVEEDPLLKAKAIGPRALNLCQVAVKQPEKIVPHIKSDIDIHRIIGEYCNVFTDSGGMHINHSLILMHGLRFEPDEMMLEALSLSELERLDSDIARCRTFYSQSIREHVDREVNISTAIWNIQHDSAFYIGMYDPAVN